MTAPAPPDPLPGDPGSANGDSEQDTPATKGERTRQRLLTLAVARFGQRGYRATSVTDITREAGLTQAACYAYFDNKAALFREAVDTDVAGLIDSVRVHIHQAPVDQLLVTMLIHLAAKLDEHPLAMRVLGGQEPEGVAALRELPAIMAARTLLAQRLADAQSTGEARADVDPTRLAAGVQIVLLGLLTSMTVARGASGADDASTQLVEQPDVIEGVVEVLDALLRTPRVLT
jgi:AcrR family transcriptional regulator